MVVMARKPANFEWLRFDDEQIDLLNFTDFIGNNGWARNSQLDALMVSHLNDCAENGLDIATLKRCMGQIGYGRGALHELDRWESKRTTGKFGR